MRDKDEACPSEAEHSGIDRRRFLRGAAVGMGSLPGAGLLLAACGSSHPASSSRTSTGDPRRGGTLQAGFSGGTSADALDPLNASNSMESAYSACMFDSLIALDRNAIPQLQLAEELTPSKDARKWTIRLHRGVSFHDGRELTADDVVYTLRRIANKQHPAVGDPQLFSLELARVRKVDKYTVTVPFSTPYATFDQALATYYFPIVPVGFNPAKPVGTGAFRYESFSPGQSLTMTRNPDYWQTGKPYVDKLVINDVADETAQVNGLASGQFNLIDYLSGTSIESVQSGGGHVTISQGGAWNPFTMRADQAPFDDVRVRQAFRLIVDRPAMREAVFNGHGTIGNDLYAIWDPIYDHSIPQREQDLEQAKALLKQAGHESLGVTLVTSQIAQGVVQSAQVFAQQASAAGVTVKVQEVPTTTFFGPNYLKWPFAQDVWFYNPFFPQIALSDVPSAPFDETHYADSKFVALYRQALATVDAKGRTDIAHEMQTIYHDNSGYIIPCFSPTIDGYSAQVQGVQTSKIGLPFNNYDLKSLWLNG
jgi:peptide/nickel transport system substrate-binding protein